jgi:hypothetical protein
MDEELNVLIVSNKKSPVKNRIEIEKFSENSSVIWIMSSGPSLAVADPSFPDRKQDVDHRELNSYMEKHEVREILAGMIAYLVENRSEDHLQGAIDFLNQYKKA